MPAASQFPAKTSFSDKKWQEILSVFVKNRGGNSPAFRRLECMPFRNKHFAETTLDQPRWHEL